MKPADYRKALTERIIEQLDAGTASWTKPWDPTIAPSGSPYNATSARSYKGGNRLWLACQGYADPRWCTYKQAQEQGWQVNKGERASVVEYWQWEKETQDENGQTVTQKLDVPRVFYAHVFNAAQMQNVPERLPRVVLWPGDLLAERLLKQSAARILHDQQDAAFYSPSKDQIHLPPKAAFTEAGRYYATALHELGHWSGHPDRLNRDLANRFGTADYAREELRAEMASYFVCSDLGIAHDPGQHASYVGSWIDALRKDHNELFRAAKEAEQISDYVLQFAYERQQEQLAEEEVEC